MKKTNPTPHKSWLNMQYTTALKWSKGISKNKKQSCRRFDIQGVEVRDLPENHVLFGEQGLFSTKKFHQFDILGEYLGEIVDDNKSGEYVASLEEKNICFGVDAQSCGNEMRFINCYLGIQNQPNVRMQRVYIDTYPHIVIICLKDIEINEEFLLDYGEGYINEYITKTNEIARNLKLENQSLEIPFNLLMYVDELPGYEDDKDSIDETSADDVEDEAE